MSQINNLNCYMDAMLFLLHTSVISLQRASDAIVSAL